jgi:anti-anti-sigma regulatory factor
MHFSLAKHGLVFLTRDRGARMRAELLEARDTATGPLTIDFAGVQSASYSFVDEFVGKLAESMAPDAPRLVNLPPMIARTIESSLRRRGVDAERILSASLETA